MIKILRKSGAVLLYIAALLWLVDFKLLLLFDLKMILMVLFGTVLLTAASCKKGSHWDQIRENACFNASVAGYLAAFILLFSQFSQQRDYDALLYQAALNLRPLLYGLILQLLLKGEETKEETPAPAKKPEKDVQKILKERGLTEREIEIVHYICENLSNKEIGDILFISESTVKKHSSNLYKKLEVANREQLKQLVKSSPRPD